MYRWTVWLLGTSAVLAQFPPRTAIDAVNQAYWKAEAAGHFEEAAALRDEARRLLAGVPVETPQFAGWVRNVAGLYEGGGKTAEARAVIEKALSRTGTSQSNRALLLDALGDSWEQDQNLLKALPYREQAAAAREGTPPSGGGLVRLAYLYRQLGRRNDLEAVLTTIAARAGNDAFALASLYEQDGQLDRAAAIYRQQVERAAEPNQAVAALQSLASLYERQQRYADAAAALQQAIDRMSEAGPQQPGDQTLWLRQRLAAVFKQAGQPQAADRIYQQLLAESPNAPGWLQQQVLISYADQLAGTPRAAQAESLLNDYLATHTDLQPWEEFNLLSTLARVTRLSGQEERAGEYERAAALKQAQGAPGQVSIAADLQKAQAAIPDNPGEAFRLTLRAIDAAPNAADRDQLGWQVPSIVSLLAARNAPELADQLNRRVFAVVEGWSADTVQALLNLEQNYARFLIQQRRWSELPQAVDRYRATLVAARGADSGGLEQVLQLRLEWAHAEQRPKEGLAAAQDLLALQESIAGPTSGAFLRAAEILADTLEWNGDPDRALLLRRRAVAIADVLYAANDVQRGFTRINTALALARRQRFDEAVQLAGEAVEIARHVQPAQPELFHAQLEQIRRMQQSGQSRPGGAAAFGRSSAGRIGWFQKPLR